MIRVGQSISVCNRKRSLISRQTSGHIGHFGRARQAQKQGPIFALNNNDTVGKWAVGPSNNRELLDYHQKPDEKYQMPPFFSQFGRRHCKKARRVIKVKGIEILANIIDELMINCWFPLIKSVCCEYLWTWKEGFCKFDMLGILLLVFVKQDYKNIHECIDFREVQFISLKYSISTFSDLVLCWFGNRLL